MNARQQGFSLPHLLAALALVGILAAFAANSYRKQAAAARLRQAQTALLENSAFLHRYYTQHLSYKQTSTTWPALPVPQTEQFCIRLQGQAKGQLEGRFTLKAVAFDKESEPRILKSNQDGTMIVCESSSTSCREPNDYFRGSSSADKNCRIYR